MANSDAQPAVLVSVFSRETLAEHVARFGAVESWPTCPGFRIQGRATVAPAAGVAVLIYVCTSGVIALATTNGQAGPAPDIIYKKHGGELNSMYVGLEHIRVLNEPVMPGLGRINSRLGMVLRGAEYVVNWLRDHPPFIVADYLQLVEDRLRQDEQEVQQPQRADQQRHAQVQQQQQQRARATTVTHSSEAAASHATVSALQDGFAAHDGVVQHSNNAHDQCNLQQSAEFGERHQQQRRQHLQQVSDRFDKLVIRIQLAQKRSAWHGPLSPSRFFLRRNLRHKAAQDAFNC